jgi:hypothetical protein
MNQPVPFKTACLKRVAGALARVEVAAQKLRFKLEEELSWFAPEDRAALKRNEELRERYRGTPCFVIGNGPSIGRQDLAPLAHWTTFAMSGFWKHPIVRQWQPTFYCFADPLFFDGSPAMSRFFSGMTECITATNYLMPLAGRQAIERQSLAAQSPVHYVGFQGGLHRARAKRIDFTGPVPGVESVSQMAIMSAIYLGCSPIYLIGLDHDWLAARGLDRHFYQGKTIEGHAVAHGDLDRIPYKKDMQSMLRLWEGYEKLGESARLHGCEILNATDGGFLDVFPRSSYEAIVKGLR